MPHLSDKPLVSIIVPSFNQGQFIRETIDSILTQDYRPIEVLVLDGASRDQTVEVLESYSDVSELKWWSEPDAGVVDAVNKGLARAKGEIIGIQSSDDVYLPGAVTAAVDFFNHHPDVSLVYGGVEYMDENSAVVGREALSPFSLNDYLGRFIYIPQPSAFFRAEMTKAVDGWRPEVSYAADADFWFRIAIKYQVATIDQMMARYRNHPEQRNTQKAKISRDWEKTIKDLIASGYLDLSSRRFARMGIYLARHHYTPESDWIKRTRYLYQAAAANPRAIFHRDFPKRELLPGRAPVWKFLSRIKRGLGLPARRSANH